MGRFLCLSCTQTKRSFRYSECPVQAKQRLTPSEARAFVAYYRVSTADEANLGWLSTCSERRGQPGKPAMFPIIAEYTEIESGKKKESATRASMAHAKVAKSTLMMSELDRLARMYFISGSWGA